ncbi:MAG TPA: DNA internalization-related competence protein ComEC/Rec2 [Desulfobacterales bacterium]
MTAAAYARPLIPLVVALATGLAAGCRLPGLILPAMFAIAPAAGRVGMQVRRRKPACFAPLFLFFLLGYLSLQPWLVPNLPAEHVVHLVGASKQRFAARLVTEPRSSGRRTRCVAALEHTLPAGAAGRRVIGRIRLTLFDAPPGLRRGDRIAFSGRMRSFKNFNNPGGFDYRRYMAFQNIRVSSWCSGRQVEVLERRDRASPLDRFRQRTRNLIDAAAAGDANAILRTLVLGDRSGVRPELSSAFQRTGVSHLLAISGLHIGIIATAAFFLLRWFFSRFERFLWQASVRQHAAFWAFLPAAAYALIAGMSPSTQRALIMVGVFLAAFPLRKTHDLINTVSIAALVILIVHPPSLFSISFQLSFAAVLAIVLGMQALLPFSPGSETSRPRWRRLANKVLRFVAVSIFATLGTLPLIMTTFNQVSLIGIAANCLFVPWIGFGVVPPALAATFSQPFSSWMAHGLMQAAAVMLNFCLPVVEWLAGRPFAAIQTMALSGLEIACYYLVFGLATAWLHHRIITGSTAAEHAAVREVSGAGLLAAVRRRWIRAGLVFALLVLGADVLYWVHQRHFCRDLRITVLDVGEGSAALVEMPGGGCMLIDGGGFSDNAAFDVGAGIVAPYLRQRKIRTVDTMVLSHPDSDHLNGLLYIAAHFRVGAMWSNGQSTPTLGYRRLMEIISERQIPHPAYADLPQLHRTRDLVIELLHPPPDFAKQIGAGRNDDANNHSVVVKLSCGSTSFLFPGDIEAAAEAELIAAAGAKLPSDVLLVPHHGSATSSTSEWIDTVTPKLAVISVRERYRRKLPHPDVLQRYTARGARLLRTDRHGAVRLISDGRHIEVDWARNDRLVAAVAGLPLADYWYKQVKW